MIANHPLIQNNPMLRSMMSNPQMVATMMNPDTMRAMLNMQRAMGAMRGAGAAGMGGMGGMGATSQGTTGGSAQTSTSATTPPASSTTDKDLKEEGQKEEGGKAEGSGKPDDETKAETKETKASPADFNQFFAQMMAGMNQNGAAPGGFGAPGAQANPMALWQQMMAQGMGAGAGAGGMGGQESKNPLSMVH